MQLFHCLSSAFWFHIPKKHWKLSCRPKPCQHPLLQQQQQQNDVQSQLLTPSFKITFSKEVKMQQKYSWLRLLLSQNRCMKDPPWTWPFISACPVLHLGGLVLSGCPCHSSMTWLDNSLLTPGMVQVYLILYCFGQTDLLSLAFSLSQQELCLERLGTKFLRWTELIQIKCWYCTLSFFLNVIQYLKMYNTDLFKAGMKLVDWRREEMAWTVKNKQATLS